MDEAVNWARGRDEADRARPTLKTIAALSGLAVATVSRALSDAPDIGEDTKRRVRDIAQRIGYRPNRAGVRLRTGKTNVISLVLSTEHEMVNYSSRMIASVAGALRGTPYHLILTPYFADEDPLDPIRYIVETRSADGVILNQTEPDDARVKYLLDCGFPVATHGRTNWTHPFADYDNEAFGWVAVQALVARGRRRIGLVRPPFRQSYSIHCDCGVRDSAARLGVAARVVDGANTDSPGELLAGAVATAMRGPDRPDGLVVPSASAAMTVVTAAEDMGLELGRDFDLVSKEAVPFLKRFRRDIVAIPEDVALAGDFVARALIHRIANPGEPPMQYLDVPDGHWDRP
ncbi:MAG: LacI family transcriptional regulator [Paracoccaceae bacterium]